MHNYVLDGFDLLALFDTSVSPISFAENPKKYIPSRGSIVYSVWNREGEFIYVGICGLQKSIENRNPISRMISHASGRRSGDQFCIYIHDFFVIPDLLKVGKYTPSRGALDKLTKDYIHGNLSYRFVGFQTDDSDQIVRSLERSIQSGAFGLKPLLNGVDPKSD
jgi:hypothetical protein